MEAALFELSEGSFTGVDADKGAAGLGRNLLGGSEKTGMIALEVPVILRAGQPGISLKRGVELVTT